MWGCRLGGYGHAGSGRPLCTFLGLPDTRCWSAGYEGMPWHHNSRPHRNGQDQQSPTGRSAHDLMRAARVALRKSVAIITDSQEGAVIPVLMFDPHNCLAAQERQPRGRGRRLDAAGLIEVLNVLQRAKLPLRSCEELKAMILVARWLHEGEPTDGAPWPPENETAEDRDAKEADAMTAAGSKARSKLRRSRT